MSCFCLPTSLSLQVPDNQEQDGGVDMNWGWRWEGLNSMHCRPLGIPGPEKEPKKKCNKNIYVFPFLQTQPFLRTSDKVAGEHVYPVSSLPGWHSAQKSNGGSISHGGYSLPFRKQGAAPSLCSPLEGQKRNVMNPSECCRWHVCLAELGPGRRAASQNI